MLEAFQSPSAAERLNAANAFVERVPAATEVLIVGATRDAADDLARRVTVARGATFGLHRVSLTQLAGAAGGGGDGATGRGAGDGTGGGGRRGARQFRSAAGAGARVLRAGRAVPGVCAGGGGDAGRAAAGRRGGGRARKARGPGARRGGAGAAVRGAAGGRQGRGSRGASGDRDARPRGRLARAAAPDADAAAGRVDQWAGRACVHPGADESLAGGA